MTNEQLDRWSSYQCPDITELREYVQWATRAKPTHAILAMGAIEEGYNAASKAAADARWTYESTKAAAQWHDAKSALTLALIQRLDAAEHRIIESATK